MYKKHSFLLIFIFTYVVSFSQISFQNRAVELGIDFICGTTSDGTGITFFDFDNDGWDDITLATADGKDLEFFKNNNGVFSSISLNIPSLNYQTKQVNWVDFDNDGDKDLFVTSKTSGNKLFENTGNLNFVDITLTSGFPTENMFTYGASWGDYNNDGFLDVFISNRDEVLFETPNFLYKNNGDGTFTDVSNIVGLHTDSHSSFCSAFFDFNNDGWQDIFVANDRNIFENYLYKNNGDGTFTDIGMSSGVGFLMDAMSATICDFNHDGWQDIYITNTFVGNKFMKNNGDETFTDIAESSGTIFEAIAWGAVFWMQIMTKI